MVSLTPFDPDGCFVAEPNKNQALVMKRASPMPNTYKRIYTSGIQGQS
jgi:hypothetical protein